jgi:5'-nucleotidase
MKELFDIISEYKKEEICIITDFDATLTDAIKKDGTKGSDSFSVYPNNPHLLGEEYIIQTNKLFEKYYEIEQDPKVPFDEKEKAMIQWWKEEYDLYKIHGLTKNTFIEIIQNHLIELKTNVPEFFKLTHSLDIPTIVFSAGVYNLIHGFLQKINCDYSNIHVVSNIFEFDVQGVFVGTKGDVIHSLNKTYSELSHLPVYSDLKNKKLCIVLGDSVSDMKMVEGSNFEEVISIGFLNKLPGEKGYEERLAAHRDTFDIVLDGREDFTKIIELLKNIR